MSEVCLDKIPRPWPGYFTRVMAACLVALSLAPGCASHTRTVTVEREVREPSAGTGQASKPVIVEKETTSSTTTARHESRGVLSSVVHLVGEILALPFRLIGGLLRLIF